MRMSPGWQYSTSRIASRTVDGTRRIGLASAPTGIGHLLAGSPIQELQRSGHSPSTRRQAYSEFLESGARAMPFGPIRPLIGPAAHHGATPTKDPRIPGITAGGDGAQPVGSRPRPGILIGAIVLVLALAMLAAWAVFKHVGDDSSARASAAQTGLIVSSQWTVETIDGGFRVVKPYDGNANGEYVFKIVETASVSESANASTWDPKIDGATAYAQDSPPVRIFIDAGAHNWIVTSESPTIYVDDGIARAAWYDLAHSIRFAPAP